MSDTQLLGLTLSKQIEQAAQRELELLRENAALREALKQSEDALCHALLKIRAALRKESK